MIDILTKINIGAKQDTLKNLGKI